MGSSRSISRKSLKRAVTRLERIIQEQNNLHKKEIRTLKKAINQQTTFNAKLVDLLEQLDQTDQAGSSNQVTTLPSILIDHPTKEAFDQNNQKHVARQQYSHGLFIWLLDTYRARVNLPPLENTQKESRFDHVVISIKNKIKNQGDSKKSTRPKRTNLN